MSVEDDTDIVADTAPEKPLVKQRQKKAFKDPSRWRCPHPGCNRSFAVLWRLKVHYRAPVDARGSGVERGHGQELDRCPKCHVEFQEGRHHVNCRAGRTAGPPNPKRGKPVPAKHSAESSASEETMMPAAKKPALSPSATSSPSLEVASGNHTMALAFAQLLQSLVPAPVPTFEQQLLTSLIGMQQPAQPVVPTATALDIVQALVALKQPGVVNAAPPAVLAPPAPLALAPCADDAAVPAQLLALLAAQQGGSAK